MHINGSDHLPFAFNKNFTFLSMENRTVEISHASILSNHDSAIMPSKKRGILLTQCLRKIRKTPAFFCKGFTAIGCDKIA
jgi:hypothetical protein